MKTKGFMKLLWVHTIVCVVQPLIVAGIFGITVFIVHVVAPASYHCVNQVSVCVG